MKLDPFVINGQILWSFSGGRTSAYMLWRALQAYGGKLPNSHAVVFANTGREREETLNFVQRCSDEWGVHITWLESVVRHDERLGSGHRVVDFKTASRGGQPYEEVIKKYGIPNKAYPHCNRELKLNPIRSFAQEDLEWKAGEWNPCVGIRADEADRATQGHNGVLYPLVKAFVRKPDVHSFFKTQPFDLYLPEHKGNCWDCWKKSDRKLFTLALEEPEAFEWSDRMERQYANNRPERGTQFFYRQGRSAQQMLKAAPATKFERFVDAREVFDPELDQSGGACGEESCEIWADGDLFFKGAKA